MKKTVGIILITITFILLLASCESSDSNQASEKSVSTIEYYEAIPCDVP